MTAHAPVSALVLGLALSACLADEAAPTIAAPTTEVPALPPDTVAVEGVDRAVAEVEPVGAGAVEGTVRFYRVGEGVRVRARLSGLSASGYHAFQVLRGRDCAADPAVHLGADAGTPHGGPYALPGARHAGDLGNVRGDDGSGRYDRIDPVLSLDGTASVVGRAVVVRERPDDGASADGNAGAVVGCGIVEAV